MKNYFFFLTRVSLGLFLMVAPAMAAPEGKQDMPLDISAQESLEWYEVKGLYVARGRARAEHGKTIVEADLLTAHRRSAGAEAKGQKNASDFDLLTAEGNVHFYDDKQQIFGQNALYDMDKKVIKITGNNLKYMTERDVITARDSLEYYQEKNVAVARGHALGMHQGNRIEADVMSATFGEDAAGQMEMKKMMAQGNVVIVSQEGNVSRSKRAIYDVKRDVAVLLEDVRIKQGETLLAGDEAEVDFKTGQSRLLNKGAGRVRVLLPSSGGNKKEVAP